MAPLFHGFPGNMHDVIKDVITRAEMVLEVNPDSEKSLISQFRRLGYSGPYIGMDMIYRSFHNSQIPDFYSRRYVPSEVICSFPPELSTRTISLVSSDSVSNAVFGRDVEENFYERGTDTEIIRNMVDALDCVPCNSQVHVCPSPPDIIVSRQYFEKKHPSIDASLISEPFGGILIAEMPIEPDAQFRELNRERFMSFLEQSADSGWKFYLPDDDMNILYMKR